MSGPAIHHIVADEYLNNLKKKYADRTSTLFWNSLDSGDFAPIYHLGAQGPDFLFFNMNDWPLGGAVKTVAQAYWDVQNFLEGLEKKVKDAVPDFLWDCIDALDKAADRSVALSQIELLLHDIKRNIDAIQTDLNSWVTNYITDTYDLYNVIKHPQQSGQDYAEWWWFDTLHIRRTGSFLSELMNQSTHPSLERAYALGYLTHYATDTVGHPFVNIISGGPYRTHSQRHKVVENHQDVWAFSKYRNSEFVTSNLAKLYIINGNSNELPKNLKNYLLKCIKSVYYTDGIPLYGRDINSDDLDLAYKSWLIWFTKITNDAGLPLPKPYSLNGELAAVWDKFKTNVGDLADFIGDSLSRINSLWDFLKALAALIIGPILLAVAIIDFLLGQLTVLVTAPIRFLLSLSYEALYNAYTNFRQGLVLSGFAFPHRSRLGHYLVAHMVHSESLDLCSHNAQSLPLAKAYPASKYTGHVSGYHLVYPYPKLPNCELDTCEGCPKSYFSADPSWYMTDPALGFDPVHYEYYRQFVESDVGSSDENDIANRYRQFSQVVAQGGLGNAVAFSDALYSEYLMKGKLTEYIDFNLDSDRGYAFKCWRKVANINLLNSPITDYSRTNVPIENDKKVKNNQTDIIYPDRSIL